MAFWSGSKCIAALGFSLSLSLYIDEIWVAWLVSYEWLAKLLTLILLISVNNTSGIHSSTHYFISSFVLTCFHFFPSLLYQSVYVLSLSIPINSYPIIYQHHPPLHSSLLLPSKPQSPRKPYSPAAYNLTFTS